MNAISIIAIMLMAYFLIEMIADKIIDGIYAHKSPTNAEKENKDE